MTNRGGRAQKHYQDSCLVLPDRTHAIPINGKHINSSKQACRTRTLCNVEGFDVVTDSAPPHCNPCWFKVTRSSFDNYLPVFKQKRCFGVTDTLPYTDTLTDVHAGLSCSHQVQGKRRVTTGNYEWLGASWDLTPSCWTDFLFNWLSSSTWHHQSFRL